MKKHVFLSFNVEYGTDDKGLKTVTLLDSKNGDDYEVAFVATAATPYEDVVREMAMRLLRSRLRIEDINMGVWA